MTHKSSLFKNDGYGAVVGKLVAPDIIKYTVSDGINHNILESAQLIGNVVDTEYNDVLVLGRKTDTGMIEVFKMESTYVDGPIQTYIGVDSQGQQYTVVVIPKEKFQEKKKKNTQQGKNFTEVKASGGERITVFVDVFNEVEEPGAADPYIFICNGVGERSTQTYGKNETWTSVRFPRGIQLGN